MDTFRRLGASTPISLNDGLSFNNNNNNSCYYTVVIIVIIVIFVINVIVAALLSSCFFFFIILLLLLSEGSKDSGWLVTGLYEYYSSTQGYSKIH